MMVKKESCILLGVRSDYQDHIHSQMTKLVEKGEAFCVGVSGVVTLAVLCSCFLSDSFSEVLERTSAYLIEVGYS
jgi:hypothetical protein